jgi:lipopolysaccharide export system permease protein
MKEGLKISNNRKRKVFGLQPILDFYVLREFLLPLTVLIMGFIIIFIIGDLFNDLEDFTSHKAPVSETVHYFLLKIPGNVRFILPLSVLLACMYTMANFGKNLEITAMRATGISLQRSCASIYFVALLVACVNFWFNERLVPYTERQAYIIRKKRKTEGWWTDGKKNLSYRSPDGQRTWLFNTFSEKGVQKKVYLKHFYKNGKLEWEMTADTAKYLPEKGWEFFDGEISVFDAKNNLPGPTKKFDTKILGKDLFPETPRDILISVKDIENLASWEIYEILNKTRNMPAKRKALYETTLYYRLSFFPFACLIAAFLGVPRATKNERSGIFLSVIVAVFVIVAYIASSALLRLLGNTQHLPPIIAGAGPTFIFLVLAWINVVRQN